MKELTIEIECSMYRNEVEEYLLSLNGIIETEVTDNEDSENIIIYVKYDETILSLKLLKIEILLFLNLLNVPSIISFDKHSKNKTKEYIMNKKSLCCEYCIKGIIDDLLLIDGIEKVSSNLEEIYLTYSNEEEAIIKINYNPELISIEDIEKISQN